MSGLQKRIDRPARGPLRQRHALAAFVFAWGFVQIGCLHVTLYQPQKAIHGPVVVTPSPVNFSGLKVKIRCNAHKEFMPSGDASRMCGNLVTDFQQQGAEVESVVPSGRNFIEPPVFEGARPDLTIEIESKIDYEYDYALTYPVSWMTLTIVPMISEQTFSQRVVVYGRDGSVLTEEVFRERFVEYTGLGVWSLNWLLDWFVRADEDHLSGEAPHEDFSRDFYGQVRQLAFNARIRSENLGLTSPPSDADHAKAREAAGGEEAKKDGAGDADDDATVDENGKPKKKKRRRKKRRKKKKRPIARDPSDIDPDTLPGLDPDDDLGDK